MFTKSRKVVALGLAVTVAGAGVAIAGGTGADENDADVIGKVTPTKLSKKKFKPVNLLLGVKNSSDQIDGMQENPHIELISTSKNIKINLKKAPKCDEEFTIGTPTADAKAACPPKSVIGTGSATVHRPPPNQDTPYQQVVTVFNGPGANELQLHTYGAPGTGLAGLSPTVPARIVNSPVNGYGKALSVNPAPATGAIMITEFKAKIKKSTKTISAKCKPKKFKYQRTVTYDDDSQETVTRSQKCKVKR